MGDAGVSLETTVRRQSFEESSNTRLARGFSAAATGYLGVLARRAFLGVGGTPLQRTICYE